MYKIALVVLLLALAGCGNDTPDNTSDAATPPAPATTKDKAPTNVTLSPAEQRAGGIRLGQVQARVLSGGLKVNGTLDAPPENQVAVSALLGGIVERTTLLQGARVRAGQVLATIRNPEFLTLQQNYLETRSRLEFARAEYERQAELYRQEVAPQKNFQRARAEYRAMQAQAAGQVAYLRLAGLPVGGKLTASAPVTAPRAGYLKAVRVSAGQNVTPTDVLFEIVDPGHLDVVLNVFEKDVPLLRQGQTVRYSLTNDSVDQSHQASIYLIGRTVDQDRTVRVYAHLRREDASRLPGTYVQAVIETGSATVPALPDKALLQFEGRTYVFLTTDQPAGSDGSTYRMTPVEAGVSENGYTQVTLLEGLNPATARVVVEGAYALLAKLKNADEEE